MWNVCDKWGHLIVEVSLHAYEYLSSAAIKYKKKQVVTSIDYVYGNYRSQF